MSEALIAEVLFWLAVLAILAYFFFPHRRYWVDKTRQRLFDIRDHLFDQAADGVIPFDSKAYGVARTTLNGAINTAHYLNLGWFLAVFFVQRHVNKCEHVRQYLESLDASYAELSQAGKDAVITSMACMHITILRQIVHTSPFLVWIVPFVRLLRGSGVLKTVRSAVLASRETWAAVDTEANEIGIKHSQRPTHAHATS